MLTNLLNAATAKTMLQSALLYRELELSVIPVEGKMCKIAWARYQTELPAMSHIHNWQHFGQLSGVAIVCGKVSGNLVVIDLDGGDAIVEFNTAFPEWLDTYTVYTGSGKGRHYYFYVDDLPPTTRVKGFELRANGCYVVAPPSLHPDTGKAYYPLQNLPIKRVPNMIAIADWIKGKIPRNVPNAPIMKQQDRRAIGEATLRTTVIRNIKAYTAKALQQEIDAVRLSAPGERNNRLNVAAFNLGQLVADSFLGQQMVESALIGAALACGLNESDARRTIASGLEDGAANPRRR